MSPRYTILQAHLPRVSGPDMPVIVDMKNGDSYTFEASKITVGADVLHVQEGSHVALLPLDGVRAAYLESALKGKGKAPAREYSASKM